MLLVRISFDLMGSFDQFNKKKRIATTLVSIGTPDWRRYLHVKFYASSINDTMALVPFTNVVYRVWFKVKFLPDIRVGRSPRLYYNSIPS